MGAGRSGDHELKAAALGWLRQAYGPAAEFRDGQWDAIRALTVDRGRVLVVQRTGWGKSTVYFLATRLLRDAGLGPTLLISPLLSLMRDQLRAAEAIGLRAERIGSDNRDDWDDIEDRLGGDGCDLLFVSPERLANVRFRDEVLPRLVRGIGLFVVDEAHCISDWGHDFRPDYQRIVRLVQTLPRGVPLLATTATANARVVKDVAHQLGQKLTIQRGPLARESLRLHVLKLESHAERLAWLADRLERLPGSGIIYVLTQADAELVADWLNGQGYRVAAYHAGVRDRPALEDDLRHNRYKALVATVALGMGFDKPDLAFVVHYQRPGSLVAYYQQIGRAGRALEKAYVVLLHGDCDDEIHEHFRQIAFPPDDVIEDLREAISDSDGISMRALEAEANGTRSQIEQALKLLEVDGCITYGDDRKYRRTLLPWKFDTARRQRLMAARLAELEAMHDFVGSGTCLMEHVCRHLDDPDAVACGQCGPCTGKALPRPKEATVVAALQFLDHLSLPIEPRKQWPSERVGRFSKIPEELQNEPGRALCRYHDPAWGDRVRLGKYEAGRFDDELIAAAAELIAERWRPPITWVACVPSLRHPTLVPDLAQRLADALSLPYHGVIEQPEHRPEQKLRANSVQQATNVAGAFAVTGRVPRGAVLLLDDMVDSRWTLTYCGARLREAGSGPVYPFALATTTGNA